MYAHLRPSTKIYQHSQNRFVEPLIFSLRAWDVVVALSKLTISTFRPLALDISAGVFPSLTLCSEPVL